LFGQKNKVVWGGLFAGIYLSIIRNLESKSVARNLCKINSLFVWLVADG
jgi:hypothetical protein